jgi:hypothetical protein
MEGLRFSREVRVVRARRIVWRVSGFLREGGESSGPEEGSKTMKRRTGNEISIHLESSLHLLPWSRMLHLRLPDPPPLTPL